MKRALLVFLFLPLLAFPQSPPGQDYLLLHNGDLLLVDFSHSSGGRLQFRSLSPNSRADLVFARDDIRPLQLTREQGWVTYQGDLDGLSLQIVLRETGGDPLPEIPGDSDVVVRVTHGRVKVQLHEDSDRRGQMCDRCAARLEW